MRSALYEVVNTIAPLSIANIGNLVDTYARALDPYTSIFVDNNHRLGTRTDLWFPVSLARVTEKKMARTPYAYYVH